MNEELLLYKCFTLYTYSYKLATKYAKKVSCRYKRGAKKKKPPGRQGEKDVNDCDSVVDFSTTITTDEDYIKQKRSSIVEDNSAWCYLLLDTLTL